MKRIHLRFYGYILGSILGIALVAATLTLSVSLFVRSENAGGIVAFLLMLFFILVLFIVRGGGVVIDFKKNRLFANSRGNRETYALDSVKEILISFHLEQKYRYYSADVTIYLKNGKLARVRFEPYKWSFHTYGIPAHNKEKIERQAKKCNLISCYTVD